MINVLIVDDQKHIRDGLQAIVNHFPLQLGNIYCAANGNEALILLRQYSISLVITDIMMPDMDGLALMARAKEEKINTEFIIISGYNEFSYAQRAISLGVKAYLLKPVNRDDLLASIEHVVHEIQSQRQLSHNIKSVSHRAEEADRKELALYMQGVMTDETWISYTQQRRIQLWNQYRLCLVRQEQSINQPEVNNFNQIESIINSLYGHDGYLIMQQRPHIVIVLQDAVEPNTLARALQAEQLHITIALTESQHQLKSLPSSYQQLLELYRHSYLFPQLTCIMHDHIKPLEVNWELPYEQLETLFQQIGTKNHGLITKMISTLFHKDVLQKYHIRYTQHLCRTIIQMLEDHVRVILPYMGDEVLDIECLRNVFDYPSIRDYIQALQKQLLHLNQFYYEYKCSYRNSQDLNEAIRYIHENYYKPLDLAIVSNHVSLNYTYFSNLFKKNIGKGFSEYLRDVRLDKARKLLAETDYKIIDIATMVGYDSYKSFTRSFKDVMSMQPTEYRLMTKRKQLPLDC